jgi:hypothetical protein
MDERARKGIRWFGVFFIGTWKTLKFLSGWLDRVIDREREQLTPPF